jgi:hypothetical protein
MQLHFAFFRLLKDAVRQGQPPDCFGKHLLEVSALYYAGTLIDRILGTSKRQLERFSRDRHTCHAYWSRRPRTRRHVAVILQTYAPSS